MTNVTPVLSTKEKKIRDKKYTAIDKIVSQLLKIVIQ